MTRNGRSIVLTAVLALILVYLFSIVGYIFFKDDFILAVDRIPNKTLGVLKIQIFSQGEQKLQAPPDPGSQEDETRMLYLAQIRAENKCCQSKCECHGCVSK